MIRPAQHVLLGQGRAGEPEPADPNFDDVVLLLHMDGTDGSDQFPDSSLYGKIITANGSAQVDTGESKFGGASCLFDGVGSSYLFTGTDTDFNFGGTTDFTIEFWAWLNSSTGSTAAFIASGGGTWGPGECIIRLDSGGLSIFAYSGYNRTAVTLVPIEQWVHMAIVREGTNLRFYQDGQGVGNWATQTVDEFNFNNSGDTIIGGSRFDGISINGWLDDLRITRGIARYSGAFDVPTAPFPNS